MKRSGFKRHSILKGHKKKSLKRSRMNPVGKKTKEWDAVRRVLKREFEAAGITTCELRYEGCKVDDYLSFAHGRKRRKLEGNELHDLTVLCCVPCHNKIEFLPHEEMFRIVNDTIAARRKAA